MKAILLAAFVALAPQQTSTQNNGGTIEGNVFRYGTAEGIANVEITLTLEGEVTTFRTAFDYGRVLPETVSDAKGHFILRNISPGKYTVRAQRGGWVNPASNGARLRDGGTTKSVVVAPGQHVENANLALVFGGVVAGRILNPNGDPVVRARVSVTPLTPSPPDESNPARTVDSNDHGEYRIYGIEPGKYRISATASSFDTTYFPGIRDLESATTLNIAEDEVRTSTDFVMQAAEKTYKVSGKVFSRNPNLADVRFSEFYLVPRGVLIPKARPQDSNGGLFSSGVFNRVSTGDARQRDFAFDGVRSGDYDLFAEIGRGANSKDCCDIVGRVSLHVAGQDVEGITIEIGGVDVRGRIVVANNPVTTPTASIGLALIPEDIRTRQVKTDPAGTFTIPAVLNGAWKVLIAGLPPEWAVSDIRAGAKGVYEDGLTVEDRTPELLQVIVSPAGTIDGIVRDSEQRPVAAAQIVLIPIQTDPSLATSAALNRRVTSDASGRFTLASVVIGRYAIFAFVASANPEKMIPDSNAALRTFLAPFETQRTAVTVNAGTSTALELTPIR